MTTAISNAPAADNTQDQFIYQAFVAAINDRLRSNTKKGASPLFTTDSDDLWDVYLDTFPAEMRQYHNCHCCRQFIQRFGGLVTIDEKGAIAPAIWHLDDAPERYRPAVRAMADRLRKARVTGVFVSSETNWGKAETGAWRHLAIKPMGALVFKRTVLTASQTQAEKAEDFKTVMFALDQFKPSHLETALSLLQTDALYRSEKVLGPAKWLQELQSARAAVRGVAKENVVWRAVATAPAGFCHPRSSMIGTLLDDIASGLAFEEVSRRFAAKMHPLQYLRPQAAPSAGAVAAAEKLIGQLKAAGALARRFARLDEVQALWKPVAQKKSAESGVFGHLKTKETESKASTLQVPAQTMTWAKFQRTVLPLAEQIELFVPPHNDSFTSLVTAANPDAPPILQWDHEARRNPMSWYFWNGGATAEQFSLQGGRYHPLSAIAFKPSMWNDGGYEHQKLGVVLLIEGAKDTRVPSACLFPEILKSEFHGVRSVLEAFSNDAKMEGADEASAAGVMLQQGGNWNALVRVTTGGKTLEYKLDRWD